MPNMIFGVPKARLEAAPFQDQAQCDGLSFWIHLAGGFVFWGAVAAQELR
jgi:hypothetical protein